MTITVAKTAGFCFGVDRAVDIVYDLVSQGKKVCTLGPIIHNPQLVADLQQKGVRIIGSPSEASPGETVVIRSHGVGKQVYDELKKSGNACIDATCPFVSKIHRIVEEASNNGADILIAGDESHPEVEGIRSYCSEKSFVFQTLEEMEDILKSQCTENSKPIIMVAQTTFNMDLWKNCVENARKLCTKLKIFDTICNATSLRQAESVRLSKQSDLMIVVGGRQSSNTAKLFDVCSRHTKTVLIETKDELDTSLFISARRVGITAGASTPAYIIKEVLETMSEIAKDQPVEEQSLIEDQPVGEQDIAEEMPIEQKQEAADENTKAAQDASEDKPAEEQAVADDQPVEEKQETVQDALEDKPAGDEEAATEEQSSSEQSFAELLEQSGAQAEKLYTGKRVRGTVTSVLKSEVQVDIGGKQSGVIPIAELSDDPNVKPEDVVSKDDVLELMVLNVNDQDGIVTLSKKRLDAEKGFEEIIEAKNEDKTLSGIITNIVRGGALVLTNGVKIFIPISQLSDRRVENAEEFLHKEVQFKVIEINTNRRRAVASVRAVLNAEKRAKAEAFWKEVEVGKTYTGTVKSLTDYGAFVDLGGVDGMIHITELSWVKIKHPSDVVNVGDVVEVYVKDIDEDKKKISLGYRKSEDNPWEIFKKDYSIDQVVNVKIVSLTQFGAFAEIIPGVDGLIHISQIANQHIAKVADVLTVGEKVDAKITDIDYDNKRISLSMRVLLEPEVPVEQPEEEPEKDDERTELEESVAGIEGVELQ